MIKAVAVTMTLILGGAAGSFTPPPDTPTAEPAPMRPLLPGVLVGEGVVEFRGVVCADLSHPQTPVVYLELLVTGPDSREH